MYAIIDIETTGGNYRWARITEVAIFVHDGLQVVEEFSTLVNPEISIPSFITKLTGISNEMVQDAPKFHEVADTIARLTEGKVFVAHNSQFDYNFIKYEFARIGHAFERPNLCTVRLSRKLIPDKRSYSLGKLCEDLGIELQNRHRAFGDAEATVKLLELLLSVDNSNQIVNFVRWEQPEPSEFNKYLKTTTIEDMPSSAGVLYFFDKEDKLLYIEAVNNIRKRTTAILNNKGNRQSHNIKELVGDVTFEETGSYLIAQLLAQDEILKLQPVQNRNSKSKSSSSAKHWTIIPDPQLDGFIHLKIAKADERAAFFFTGQRGAKKKLEELIIQHQLCLQKTNINTRKGACTNVKLNICKGACVDEELPANYNQRVEKALEQLKTDVQNQLIIDKGRQPNEKALVKIENQKWVSWGYLNLEEGYDLNLMLDCASTSSSTKDAPDIVKKYLDKHNVKRVITY